MAPRRRAPFNFSALEFHITYYKGVEIEFGTHALERMEKRRVGATIVHDILDDPDRIIAAADEHRNTHYLKSVSDLDGDIVTVVVDPFKRPSKVVTVMREPKKEVRW